MKTILVAMILSAAAWAQTIPTPLPGEPIRQARPSCSATVTTNCTLTDVSGATTVPGTLSVGAGVAGADAMSYTGANLTNRKQVQIGEYVNNGVRVGKIEAPFAVYSGDSDQTTSMGLASIRAINDAGTEAPYGIYSEMGVGDFDYAHNVVGVEGYVNGFAKTGHTTNQLTGVISYVAQLDTGTLTRGYGHSTIVIANAGTITSAAAYYGNIQTAAGGTISNAYGLLIPAMTRTGTITNSWGIYVDDATAHNYIRGKLGVGLAMTVPPNQLSVVGDANITGKLGLGTTTPEQILHVYSAGDGTLMMLGQGAVTNGHVGAVFSMTQTTGNGLLSINVVKQNSGTGNITLMPHATVGNVLIGTSTSVDGNRLQVNGGISAVLPVDCTGKPTGTLWNDSTVVKVCP